MHIGGGAAVGGSVIMLREAASNYNRAAQCGDNLVDNLYRIVFGGIAHARVNQ